MNYNTEKINYGIPEALLPKDKIKCKSITTDPYGNLYI